MKRWAAAPSSMEGGRWDRRLASGIARFHLVIKMKGAVINLLMRLHGGTHTWTSEGVFQRLDGYLHLVQNVAELLVEWPRFPRDDRPLRGRADEPLLLEDPQGVPDLVRRDTQALRESHDADGLVLLHGLQDGDAAV